VGRSQGRSFLGSHGDGALTTVSGSEGNATNNDWPGINGIATKGVTGTIGAGYRGCGFETASGSVAYCSISDRTKAAFDPDSDSENQRYGTEAIFFGGRLGRTAP